MTEHLVDTVKARAIQLPPYRFPQAYRETVQTKPKEMLKHEFIKPLKSDWASPIVIVPKKDVKMQLCMDYRWLNSVLRVDAYRMSQYEELVDKMGKPSISA